MKADGERHPKEVERGGGKRDGARLTGACWCGPFQPKGIVPVFFSGSRAIDTPVFRMEAMQPGDATEGPALITAATSTIVVEPGCTARLTAVGDLEVLVGEGKPRCALDVLHLCAPGSWRPNSASLSDPRPNHGRCFVLLVWMQVHYHGTGRCAPVPLPAPLHDHRRADGPGAAAHSHLHQHQGRTITSSAHAHSLQYKWAGTPGERVFRTGVDLCPLGAWAGALGLQLCPLFSGWRSHQQRPAYPGPLGRNARGGALPN
jgi:hypothetical protein